MLTLTCSPMAGRSTAATQDIRQEVFTTLTVQYLKSSALFLNGKCVQCTLFKAFSEEEKLHCCSVTFRKYILCFILILKNLIDFIKYTYNNIVTFHNVFKCQLFPL